MMSEANNIELTTEVNKNKELDKVELSDEEICKLFNIKSGDKDGGKVK